MESLKNQFLGLSSDFAAFSSLSQISYSSATFFTSIILSFFGVFSLKKPISWLLPLLHPKFPIFLQSFSLLLFSHFSFSLSSASFLLASFLLVLVLSFPSSTSAILAFSALVSTTFYTILDISSYLLPLFSSQFQDCSE